jgi:hypothetical protein
MGQNDRSCWNFHTSLTTEKGGLFLMQTQDDFTSQTPQETSKVELTPEIANARLLASFQGPRSRRTMLKGALAGAVGATGLAVGATLLTPQRTHAEAVNGSSCTIDSIKTILSVAATAERLAVTFYTNGLKNADKLGISVSSAAYDVFEAALIEEQIHELFFVANGGVPLASTFSFPHGDETFEDLSLFIATLEQLEGVFDSAFLCAIHEFAAMGQPVLARIAGQIATVETMHLALGRYIGGLIPADNWAFSPVLIPSVGAAPAIVKAAGYLSPTKGNSYTYQQVSTADEGVLYREPYAVGC